MNKFSKKRSWGPTPNYPFVESYNKKSDFVIIAGPCSVENELQIYNSAKAAADNGATHLRGGVFYAGTYPGKNFGWKTKELITAYGWAAKKNKLKNIIEVLDYRDFELIDEHATCYQVGCRQQQNYTLLRELGKTNKPVFLKRHPGSTIDEFLGSAEHLLVGGVKELYLIERGSSTNATHVRWDLSISMIPAVKSLSKIPIIVDGSHGSGRADLVEAMTMAGVVAGADGILVEFHENPEQSASDADQALSYKEFAELMFKLKQYKRLKNALDNLAHIFV